MARLLGARRLEGALADLIFAEGWQFAWLAFALTAVAVSHFRGSQATEFTAWMLLAGWFITNVFWPIRLVYVINDLVFGLATFGLWAVSREPHVLTVATLYGSMLLLHGINPPMPGYLVSLNVLYGFQLAAAVYRGKGGSPRDQAGRA